LALVSAAGAQSVLTFEIRDYLTLPDPGKRDPSSQNFSAYSRANMLREEPGADRGRLFISDLDGPLYILDKKTKKLTTYLDFNGKGDHKGIFHRLVFETGWASGLFGFQFDPDYRRNGRFYTVHIEDPAVAASASPDNSSVPGLKTAGYQVTAPIATPGKTVREAVLIEWTDTNTANTTFEGTAREILRVQYNGTVHPMGDLIFNPTAKRGDADWRALYVASGDGQSGESRDLTIRNNPQRLDTLVGKVLRIVPDINEHKDSSTLSENGRYRIPKDNPFVAMAGVRPEIWAYGLRNPHRLSWDVDPADPKKNYLLANVIGLTTWETVAIIHRGANYGYSEREGNQQIVVSSGFNVNRIEPLPADDRISVRVGDKPTGDFVKPTYPVIIYPHQEGGGDAISSGFVYRGKIAALYGKFIFGDITTGRVWWADLKEMVTADDGDSATMASIHPVQFQWASPIGKEGIYQTLAPIVSDTYHARGGQAEFLPGYSARVGKGRADIRLAFDGKGEIFIISKSDGMIREVVGATTK
jgi:hypothetical protein